MPAARPVTDVSQVRDLHAQGRSDRDVSQVTGVPINTIRTWRNHGISRAAERALDLVEFCPTCGGEPHQFGSLPFQVYAYLLGVYLGDGCITRNGNSWTLRVTLDRAYPLIISECCDAIEGIRGGNRPTPRPHHGGSNCVVVSSTYRSWTCLFPQHGPGRKHQRKIELAAWQQHIVDEAPQQFLRGLIHTDGWRGLNRVCSKGKDYAYSRYQFSNRSDDVRKLFTDACEKLGVKWRQWTRYHVSVSRRESVAILDSFIGPKY